MVEWLCVWPSLAGAAMIFMGSKSNENIGSESGWAYLQDWFVPQWISGVGAFVRCLKSWRQSHSCCLQEGVTLPSGWMFLLGLLTRTERAGPSALRSPRSRVPVRLSVFCGQPCFCQTKKGGVDCHFADMLRHSQNTLMVILASAGRGEAGLLAWHASCLPLSWLRAVTLREVREKSQNSGRKKTV